jgi:hypothetical protein
MNLPKVRRKAQPNPVEPIPPVAPPPLTEDQLEFLVPQVLTEAFELRQPLVDMMRNARASTKEERARAYAALVEPGKEDDGPLAFDYGMWTAISYIRARLGYAHNNDVMSNLSGFHPYEMAKKIRQLRAEKAEFGAGVRPDDAP